MEDKENYIRMLEQKRDREIPEIIKELELNLEIRKKEKVDIDLEIQHLRATENRKTIFDLPVVCWKEVKRNLIQPQNEIQALSLSSAKMTHFLDTVFHESPEFIKMEKAFSILLTNFYLEHTDLLNCMETTSEDLGKVASRTWHFLEHPPYISVDAIGSYQDFRAEVASKTFEHKIWTCFAGKIIQFNLRGRPSDRYWNEAKEFLQDYGYFCLNIELLLEEEDLETGEKTDYIHNMLLNGKLPNLRFFHVYLKRPAYGLRAQIETRSLQNYFCLWTLFLLIHVENKEAILKLAGLIAEAWDNTQSRCALSFKQLRSLNYDHPDEKFKKPVIAALKNCLSHTKELKVLAHKSISNNLQFAERFAALSKISIYVGHGFYAERPEDFTVSRNIRLPTVRTLTYGLDGGPVVPRLRNTMSAFPSLRCVNLKTRCPKNEFIGLVVKKIVEQAEGEVNVGVAFEDFDIFQLISKEQPLTESDIWKQVPKLNVFTLITAKMFFDKTVKTNMVEKYTRDFRDRKSIRLEKYLETVATQSPSTVRDDFFLY